MSQSCPSAPHAGASRYWDLRSRSPNGSVIETASYLRRFPVDILKIDREFTSDVVSPEGSALLGGIVQLGRSLGLEIVAEGIEQPDQRDRIAATLCDQGQGYLFARPAPYADVSRLLSTRSATRPTE